jgi:hypothetical protein
MKNLFLLSAVTIGFIGLTACSSETASTPAPKTETEAAKKPTGPPEPVTAKTAYYAMYTPARKWATDLVAISLTSGSVEGVKDADGKFGMWTAIFASPSLRSTRTYTYAVAEQMPAIQKGIKAEGAEPWGGPNAKAMPFDNSDFKTDSDAAYTAGLEKAGSWVKEHPGKPLSLSLGAATRFPNPVWYILFGDTKSGYAVFVNATTGKVLEGK